MKLLRNITPQMGKALPDIFKSLYPGFDVDTLLHTNNQYVAANAMKSEAFDGVEELLIYIQTEGAKLAILTSGSSKVLDILNHHNLEMYFTSIVHHERVQNPKPDPEGFLLACVECGVKPQEAIMVGDTSVDIETGRNASALATIAVTHGYGLLKDLENSKANYVVDDIAGIKDIIAKLITNT
jgi:HAD superfamily hydrolase (TIGR01549 family)